VGFENDQGMLPYSPRVFPGYRLLSEYFAFPQKFLFFEIAGLTPAILGRFGNAMEIQLHLNRAVPELEQNISADGFRLGCAPVVNLFPKKAEPIQLTQRFSEYRVVPDSRRPISYEVYSVQSVAATLPGGKQIPFQPFFSIRHGMVESPDQAFWQGVRRYATRSDEQVDHGTEVYLSLVDLDYAPATLADAILDVDAICLNRDLPVREPVAGGRPGFRMMEGGPVSIECMTQPTPTRRVPLEKGVLWRLISHLLLNHLSLVNSGNGPDALQEMLKLYDTVDSDDTRSKVAGVLGVRHQRVVGRIPGVAGGGFCRGVEVTVDFDEQRFPDNSLFLFSAVIERFLATYCSINSFTQLVATSRQRNGEVRQWSPRVAQRPLL
jgi:type VI secretion system protein ImpG